MRLIALVTREEIKAAAEGRLPVEQILVTRLALTVAELANACLKGERTEEVGSILQEMEMLKRTEKDD